MARAHPTVLQALRSQVPKGARLLVAVSGGIDSVVLLHGLTRQQGELDLRLHVAHVNHRLRETAERDATFVRALAERLALPFHLDVLAEEPPSGNIERWARDLRYRALQAVRSRENLEFIVTAHTADDQAETLCMRLVANKEPRGILRRDEQRALLRPLLGVPRATIEHFAREHQLEWREDESNTDLRFLRNQVRHRLLPTFKAEFGDRVLESLADRAHALDDDSRFLESLVQPSQLEVEELPFGSREWFRLLRSKLEELPVALQWRLVDRVLLAAVGFPIGRRKGAEVVRFVLGEAEQQQLAEGMLLKRRAGGCVLERESSQG